MASDQYALAVAVYEWLTGQHPFSGSFAEIASQHLFVQPPSLRELVPEISQEIEQVVMTGLSKDPRERFTRIEAFARALETASADISPTYITPLFSPQTPAIQATPAPDRIALVKDTTADPMLRTPVSEAPVSDILLPDQNTPIPNTPVTSGSPPERYARRTLFVGIAGATLLVVAASAGVSYAVFSHQHSVQTAQPLPSPSAYGTEAMTVTPSQPTALTGQVLNTYTGNHFPVGCAAWSPHSLRIASSGLNVQLWDALTGANVVSYNGHISQVEAVDWSPDGSSLVSCGDDQTLRVWDAATGTTRLTMSGHRAAVWTVRWSPDGHYLASGSGDTRVGIWNAQQGSNLFFYQGHSDTAYAVSFSADSQRVASASYDMTVQIWQTASGSQIFTYTGHNDHVLAVAWAPLHSNNPSYIASGGNDTTIQVWDANNNGNVIMHYAQHTSTVFTLCWSPDGRTIVSGDAQGQIRVWDVASGRTIYIFTQHTSAINWVSWSPDGQYIASASKDQSVRVWRAPR
jgi:WD40 repeat protein